MHLQAPRRRALLLGGAAAALGLPIRAHATTSNTLVPWKGSKAAALQATDLVTEKVRTLADFQGSPLILNFWATWCGPCRTELPSLNAAVERFASRGLRLLAVNHGEMPERVRRFLDEVPIRGTVLLDRSLTQLRAWDAQGLPASFAIDSSGKPRFRAAGEIDWLAPVNLGMLEELVGPAKR